MDDIEAAPGSPSLQNREEPQGLNDPADPLQPGIEEEDRPNAPMGDPTADVDAFEDEEAPETVEAMNDAADPDMDDDDDDDDGEESELEELDETQFQDFDPSALNIPDKPVAVDETNVGLLGVHKRKRTEEEERERKKKKKEGRREKPKKSKKRDDEDDFEGGVEIDGKRSRKSKVGADGRPTKRRARTPTEEDEESLTPEERRRRALDRKMDEALKAGSRNSRRRGRGIDLEAAADDEIRALAKRMIGACEQDSHARAAGLVATHKLAILPEVVELMNRNTIQSQIEDPESEILTSVRFMLEPADQDAALPNYKIQRELFKILGKLTLGRDALKSSELGKVVLFYTKSTQPQPEIKRAAEKLIGEWMRVVLGKHGKDRRNAAIETKMYDPTQQASSQAPRSQAAVMAERRKKALEQPIPGNRARVEGGVGTYTIAPVSNLSMIGAAGGRKLGASGEDAFRKIAARGAVKAAGPGGARKG